MLFRRLRDFANFSLSNITPHRIFIKIFIISNVTTKPFNTFSSKLLLLEIYFPLKKINSKYFYTPIKIIINFTP